MTTATTQDVTVIATETETATASEIVIGTTTAILVVTETEIAMTAGATVVVDRARRVTGINLRAAALIAENASRARKLISMLCH
jgi:hypothetical protein